MREFVLEVEACALSQLRPYCPWLLLLTIAVSALAQQQPYSPKRGDPVRQALLDALRAPVEKKLKRQIVFKVDHLKVQDGWAFLRGVPQQPGGRKMDYSGTVYERLQKDGVFDDWICALFKKSRGEWRVVKYVIGATDVVYEGWGKEYGAPAAIFKE